MKAKKTMLISMLIILGVSISHAQTIPGYELIFQDEFDPAAIDYFNYDLWNQKSYTQPGHTELNAYVGDGHLAGVAGTIYDNSTSSLKLNMLNTGVSPSMTSTYYPPWHPSYAAHVANSCATDFNDDPVDPPGDRKDCHEEYEFVSGYFSSHQEFQYGYFETRCKLPKGANFFQAFWLYGQNGDGDGDPTDNWYNEIDIFEMDDVPGGSTISTNIHWSITNGTDSGLSGEYNNTCSGDYTDNLDNNFHTYGLEWTPNYVAWFQDGQRVRVFACNDFTPRHAMKLITNFALRNKTDLDTASTGYGDNDFLPNLADFPATWEIDYIRVYKRRQVKDFGVHQGWQKQTHRRMMADVNGDGLDDIVGFGDNHVKVALAFLVPVPATPCSTNGVSQYIAFHPPTNWISDYCHNQGWEIAKHPIIMADVNSDGSKDIVGFASNGVYVSYAPSYPQFLTGITSFSPKSFKLANFGFDPTAGGWNETNHRRMMADVNGDGKEDIVGFGWSDVYVAISTGTGFLPATVWVNNFCHAQGWKIDKHPISLADVDGNGSKDIVGFSGAGVRVSYAPSFSEYILGTHTFDPAVLQITSFGSDLAAGNWQNDKHIRTTADVNGDGRADVIGFGWSKVFVSIAWPGGAGFTAPIAWKDDFTIGQGWSVNENVRMLRDISGDGKADIVGFDPTGVKAAIALPSGGFGETFQWRNYYGTTANTGNLNLYDHIRTMADVNGDGKYDIVCFTDSGVMVSPSSFCFRPTIGKEQEIDQGWTKRLKPTFIEEIPKSKLNYQVIPNPSSGMVKLIVENGQYRSINKIEIYNIDGKKIHEITTIPTNISIDLTHERNGIYIIKILDDKGVSTIRFVKS